MNKQDRIFWKMQQLRECLFWIQGETDKLTRLLDSLLEDQKELIRRTAREKS